MVASPTTAPIAPPSPSAGPLLRVRMFDMHAARDLHRRLRAAGVPDGALDIVGRRVADGLVEPDVRPVSQLTQRWRLNATMAVAATVCVGIPMGVTVITFMLGEGYHSTIIGAVVGGVGTAWTLLRGVWGDHLQRFEDARPSTRLEGSVVVSGDEAIARARLLLPSTDLVMAITEPARAHGSAGGVGPGVMAADPVAPQDPSSRQVRRGGRRVGRVVR